MLDDAVTLDHADCVRVLLSAKADVNARSVFGETPLHLAATRHDGGMDGGEVSCMRLLLERKANVNAVTLSDETPLHYAAIAKMEKAVALLLEFKADITLPNVYENSPLSAAVNHGAVNCAARLAAAAPNVANVRQESALFVHLVAKQMPHKSDGCISALRKLLEAKCDVFLPDKYGTTVWQALDCIKDPEHALIEGANTCREAVLQFMMEQQEEQVDPPATDGEH